MWGGGYHGWMWVTMGVVLLLAMYAAGAIDLPRSWLPRLGTRRTEARVNLLDRAYRYALREYGNKGYEFWKDLIGRNPIFIPHPDDGRVEVEISPIWDDVSADRASHRIRVLVSLMQPTPA